MAVWANLPMAKELSDMASPEARRGTKDGLKKLDSEERKKLFARFDEL